MKKVFDTSTLAVLAWFTAMAIVSILLSSCSTTGARYGTAYDDMSPRKCGKTSQTFRNW